ncbi:MAG: NAD(P)-binding domain-containing protein [Bradymonadaceae bacterium]|nr:NAD(P)-binding domain-containing protein [Lujinxingiaceae bacterium]
MTENTKKRLAVLGAGPIGIEAALRGVRDGYTVDVYERGQIGAHIASWSHVTFFTPWSLNRSAWGEAVIADGQGTLQDAAHSPTGREYLEQYLVPLTSSKALAGRIHERCEVLAISRKYASKGDFVGRAERGIGPFVMLLREDGQERFVEADVIIDATGIFGQPNNLGVGGLPALGERELGDTIERHIPDVLGAARAHYSGKRVLVVGEGHSAATTLQNLHMLKAEEPTTHIVWLFRPQEAPYAQIADDSLPLRRALTHFANEASCGKIEGITAVGRATIMELQALDEATINVVIDRDGRPQRFEVDRIVANVGYRPDQAISRELQVHYCYASEGPMALAAALLASGGGGGADCLAQASNGPETLLNPEPNFFVLGSKSYGRGSNFILKVGFEQIDAVFSTLLKST